MWRRSQGGGMIQFFDTAGNVFPLKPGTIWFNTATIYYLGPEITFAP